jgi:hypothetical protein
MICGLGEADLIAWRYQWRRTNNEFDHVGIHHQRSLSPGLQAIFDRHAKAAPDGQSAWSI